jgi:hypothetical protein
MSNPKPDDLEAVRTVVAALQEFEAKDQQRIIRWAQEKLGLIETASTLPASGPSGTHEGSSSTLTGHKPSNIKTFIDFKNPSNDIQFAAAIVYYYQFETPEPQRKVSITPDDLQEACRLTGRPRFKVPGQTLINARHQGYLDKGSERGSYVLNSVGENLVAMTLPESAAFRPPKGRSTRKVPTRAKGGRRSKKRAP